MFCVSFWVGGLYRYKLRSLRGHDTPRDGGVRERERGLVRAHMFHVKHMSTEPRRRAGESTRPMATMRVRAGAASAASGGARRRSAAAQALSDSLFS